MVKGIYDMNVTMASLANVTNRQSRMFADVYNVVETKGQTVGKGSGQTAVQLKAELDVLKQELEMFGAQIASIFTHIDQRFGEMLQTDSRVKEVIEKVVVGIQEKFNESDDFHVRFEKSLRTLKVIDAMHMDLSLIHI